MNKAKFLIGSLVALTMSLFSCTTERKASAWMNTHPEVLSELCATKYPPKVNYIKGDTVHYETTIILPGDSIPCPEVKDVKTGRVYVPKVKCPDVTYTIDSVVIHDTCMVENTAKVESLKFLVADLNKDNDRLSSHKKRLTQLLILVSVLGAGAGVLIFRR